MATFEELQERLRHPPIPADDDWINANAEFVWPIPLWARTPQVVRSPNGFPYFVLWPSPSGENCQPASVAAIFEFARDNFWGIVIFDDDSRPLWELTHGQILSWQLYGKPNPPRFWNIPKEEWGAEGLKDVEMWLLGAPSEEMLPPLVRRSLRYAMKERLGIERPRVGNIVRPHQPGVGRIVFDLDPAVLGGEQGVERAYHLLVWYFPYCIPSLGMATMANSSWMVEL